MNMKNMRFKTKSCILCQTEYVSKNDEQLFCSRECSIEYKQFITRRYCKLCGVEVSKKSRRLLCDSCSSLRTATKKLRFELFKRDNFTCQYCGRNVKNDGIKIVIDHVIPYSKGGKTEMNNLVTACKDCNSGKIDILLSNKLLS